ncbi:MAG: Lrp/AsnC family transcriptional regulator [Candidatus Hodarchaeota archaeon]
MAAVSRVEVSPQSPVTQVDDIDYSIIRQLTADPRMSFSELGDKIGRSRATARERVKRLVAHGMIDFNLVVRRDILESFKVATIVIKTKGSRNLLTIDGCPRLLTAVGPDSNGEITVMMLGESETVLKKCIEHFRQRNNSRIVAMDTAFMNLQVPHYLTLRTFSSNKTMPAACIEKCPTCEHYQSGACYGCPADDEQFGSL